ncbi:Hypothetical protein SRAE_2000327350 [Strongyloides ratti]|uniref:Uncharacterized protein n=1 Tax=Strongyloides ratti TaxID=34506 RepID=A0A090LKE2_STRRB|nr:Hypothetical protein SRAE_2000327350 [Strongyloides ratti]CEF68618.1 Hypothetical protein SRAE_2000327350 [Strongyloides ratti]
MFNENPKKDFINPEKTNKFYPKQIEYGNIYFKKTPIIFTMKHEEINHKSSSNLNNIFFNFILYFIGGGCIIYVLLKFIKVRLSNNSFQDFKSVEDSESISDDSY